MNTRNMNIHHHWFWGNSDPKAQVVFTLCNGEKESSITDGYSRYLSMTSMRNDSFNLYNLMNSLRAVPADGFTPGNSSIGNTYGVVLGTGNEPATYDDVTLSGEPVSGFTYSKTLTETYGENYYEVRADYTVTNNNDSDITIGEIGLFLTFVRQSAQYNATYKYWPVLLERTALENPITIPAGGVGQITYTVRTNLPAA